jgi:hypothetical protein
MEIESPSQSWNFHRGWGWRQVSKRNWAARRSYVGISTVLRKEKGIEMTATEPFGAFAKNRKISNACSP